MRLQGIIPIQAKPNTSVTEGVGFYVTYRFSYPIMKVSPAKVPNSIQRFPFRKDAWVLDPFVFIWHSPLSVSPHFPVFSFRFLPSSPKGCQLPPWGSPFIAAFLLFPSILQRLRASLFCAFRSSLHIPSWRKAPYQMPAQMKLNVQSSSLLPTHFPQ